MNPDSINYNKLIKVINQDIKEVYGNEFAFELQLRRKYYKLIIDKKHLKVINEYGIIRTPMVYDYLTITEIIKIIKSQFAMFYLCCFEISSKIEFEIKVIALPQQNCNILLK